MEKLVIRGKNITLYDIKVNKTGIKDIVEQISLKYGKKYEEQLSFVNNETLRKLKEKYYLKDADVVGGKIDKETKEWIPLIKYTPIEFPSLAVMLNMMFLKNSKYKYQDISMLLNLIDTDFNSETKEFASRIKENIVLKKIYGYELEKLKEYDINGYREMDLHLDKDIEIITLEKNSGI